MRDTSPLLADHVLMALQDKGGDIFLARRCLLDYTNISHLVDTAFQIPVRGEFLEERLHALLVSRLTRDTSDLLEDLKYFS